MKHSQTFEHKITKPFPILKVDSQNVSCYSDSREFQFETPEQLSAGCS